METPNRAYYKPHRDAKGFGPEIYLDVTNYEYCIDGTTRSFAQSVIYLKTQYQISNKEAIAFCNNLIYLDISTDR